MRFKKILTAVVLSATMLTMAIPTTPAYAITPIGQQAKAVPAVALGCPYHFTLSIQNDNLIFSGSAPDYHAKSIKIDLVKPVNYATSTINPDGIAVIERDPNRDIHREPYIYTVQPSIVMTLTHTLDPINSNMAKTVQSPNGLVVDLSTAPKIDISTLSDGVYNLRTGYIGDPAYDYFYHDEILIVIQGGKASLQLLPTYQRYVTSVGATGWYSGYSLWQWNVQPAITPEAYALWRKGL